MIFAVAGRSSIVVISSVGGVLLFLATCEVVPPVTHPSREPPEVRQEQSRSWVICTQDGRCGSALGFRRWNE
jgi:hypothetical protein